MKLMHIADLHLFSAFDDYSLTKKRERNQELLDAFMRAMEYARSNYIQAVLICGDLVDTTISDYQKREIEAIFDQYKEIYFFYLKGNHDDLNFECENVYSFDEHFVSYQFGDLMIGGVENLDYLDEIQFEEDQKNILLLHGTLLTEIPLNQIKNHSIDYLALGHIHSYQEGKIDGRCKYIYPGCLEGRGYDEIGQKGFVIIDTNDFSSEFIVNTVRKVEEYKIDLTGADHFVEACQIIQQVCCTINPNEIVLISLEGSIEVGSSITFEQLKYYIETHTNYYQLRIKNRIKYVVDPMKYRYDQSLKGRFIRKVLESDEENKEDIIRYGLIALEKGEV